jgi:hypothetical protein
MGTLHEDQYTILIISRSILLRIRNVSDRSCRKNQNTRFMFTNYFLENLAVYEIVWNNTIQTDRPQMTVQYGACAFLHAVYLTLQVHTQNTYACCFSTATIVTRTRFNITLYLHFLSCYYLLDEEKICTCVDLE